MTSIPDREELWRTEAAKHPDIELYENPDHLVWAAAFCKAAAKNGFDPTKSDHVEWVGTWIANAMMHGYDHANGALPSGSGFALNAKERAARTLTTFWPSRRPK